MLHQRASGLLLHITSLPSAYGLGDLGPAAYRFADFLAAAGQTYWQILPLTPVDPATHFSPYSSPSAFAGNTLLISLEQLIDDGLLTKADCRTLSVNKSIEPVRRDWLYQVKKKSALLKKAVHAFQQQASQVQRFDYEQFCARQAFWLDDYALFMALQETTGETYWTRWPTALRQREAAALAQQTEVLHKLLETTKVLQYLFFQQWNALITYCYARRIHLVGDIPIYVQHNSADVWAYPSLFKLDATGQPVVVAGAPPDYFSADGQRWGNPIYDWPEHERNDFSWWVRRLRHQMSLYSLTRLDHFLGFAVYWEIPAHEPTARVGQWVRAPIEAFMHTMHRQFVQLPIVAEDLGARNADVQPVLRHYGLPAMRVLQFGFGADLPTSSHAPHNHVENVVVYSGTHDNNTTLGWFRQGSESLHQQLTDYLGLPVTEENVTDHICRLAMQSVGRLTILPVQDILNLNEIHRMNTPGQGERNWQWQLQPTQLTDDLARKLLRLSQLTGRA